MKKALTITLAGTLFTIEEDAYQKLDGYLKSVQAYFGANADGSEIIKDIEARMAEQLMENKTPAGIVTIDAVDKLISTMGRVEDFGDSDKSQPNSSSNPKRLYRDTDDVVIAGVASGIAAYIGIDPLLVRLGFIILAIITSGAAILIYIICVLVIPKAETAAEKIKLHGGPVTLNTFRETVKKNFDEVKKSSALDTFVRGIGKVIYTIVTLIVKLVGFALLLASIIAGFAATFVFVNLAFNIHTSYRRVSGI
jgi:phage shock protein PspC (stress-responsive transcriptional regulator)